MALQMMARSLSDILASVHPANAKKLDQEIDFEHKRNTGVVSKHLGRIADSMTGWEGAMADSLNLTEADRSDIKGKNHSTPNLERREALGIWKARLGKAATYRALIEVFFRAGEVAYADLVCDLLNKPEASNGVEAGDGATPTTTAQAGHISFSPSMGPEQLAQWLLQEYGSDYRDDVEKLKKAKINGTVLLNDLSTLLETLDFSLGFKLQIKAKVKQLNEVDGSLGPASVLPSSTAANLPSPQREETDDGGSQGRKKSEVDQALPSMLQMSSLKRKSGDNINIIQQVAPHWQGFAVRLDFDRTGAKLQTIERRCHYDPEACCKEAMQLWLEGKGSRQPPTWKLLVDILYECDLKVLAGQVEQATK